jgi:hypothetical protein
MLQELARQKRLLEQDLHEIEDRLRDQEDRLQTQKLALEAEIRDRDLRIQHWQLELRAKQVCCNNMLICSLFNSAVSSSYYIASHGRMTNEH